MQKRPTAIQGDRPSGGTAADVPESGDLKAIRRDIDRQVLFDETWKRTGSYDDHLYREFAIVAHAAQNWRAAAFGDRLRALRILVKRFGRTDAILLTALSAPKSMQPWHLSVRQRKPAEKTDGGKNDNKVEQDHLDYVIGKEVYQRMKAGQSKEEAVEAVKEAYRTGAPYPSVEGGFPAFNRPIRQLPEGPAIDKWLNRFRRESLKRGYVDPSAANRFDGKPREPDLKLADIPKRGRRRSK